MKYANLLQKQFKKYFFISETCVSLLYQITTMKALLNNNKPATHFIEVYSDGLKTNQEERFVACFPIGKLKFVLKPHSVFYTIAIFKIRLK